MKPPVPAVWPELLAQAELMRDLDAAARAAFWERAGRRSAERASRLFSAGEPADHLFLIAAGRIKLVRGNAEGQEVIVRFAGPGEVLGAIAGRSGARYPLSAEVVDDADLAVWARDDIASLVTQHPAVSGALLEVVAQRMGAVQDQLQELATERVARRVARALLRLAAQLGRKTDEGVLIDLPLSRQNLAELTGTTLFTVSRLLSGWESQGLLEVGRERVVIRSPHALAKVAEDLP